jgi:hypothetical protein
MPSPYEGQPKENWLKITQHLVAEHPLHKEWVEIVQDSWTSIFSSKIGHHGFLVGRDINPKPQIMGFLLHELIALETAARHPGVWRGERTSQEKDLVHIPNDLFSVEIKTSSDNSKIFGNRSYAQKTEDGKKAKVKSGYYLTVNFEKFMNNKTQLPMIRKIAFGWVDHSDWVGQNAPTGQQSSLPAYVYELKLLKLHP